jgi:antibiotic biosynthesis monooxygenase (ABM) superfamily enzyme
MIARIWHGYTSKENAPKYENVLINEVIPSIEDKKIAGFRNISVLKRSLKGEFEFITIMRFDNLECVKDFMGEHYEHAYIPEPARQVLSRFDAKAQHYDIIDEIIY